MITLVDSLKAEEVVNCLLPQDQITLFSKPLKNESLENMFALYDEYKG
ncbi:hypothetical protein [Oceaniferula spumae]